MLYNSSPWTLLGQQKFITYSILNPYEAERSFFFLANHIWVQVVPLDAQTETER